MKKIFLLALSVCTIYFSCSKQNENPNKEVIIDSVEKDINNLSTTGVTLSANGPGDTYELINSVFGGTGNVVEAPDCSHTSYGRHITEIFDNDLQTNVFAFHIHLTPDNDKCVDSDRQRNEIKIYDQSPANLKATKNERVIYKWKFKLDAGFKPSGDFTHIHQVKPIDGGNTLPIITITPRYKASGDILQVIHTGDTEATSQKYIASIPLADFKGQWVEVTEKSTFSFNGKYQILITRISDGKVLLDQAFTGIEMWRAGTTTCRPKWGIYRRTLQPQVLRNETVWFNDFNITEY